MPHCPGHRRSRLQGLLDRGQGRGLFGPNLPPGGVPLGGRMNLIGGGGPNPAALAGSRSFTNRIGASGVAPPTSPRTFRTEGRKVSDIFKNAQFGSRPAAQSPLAGYGQFGPQAQQVQQVQQVQGVQGGPDLNALAAAAGQRLAGTPDADVPPPGIEEMYGATGTGPGDILDTSQSFFGRMMGEKGSGKRSDISRAMMEAGARMMQGSKEGTFATIGLGLEAGLGAYDEAKGMRAWEEDREIAADERAEKARREQAAITAILGDDEFSDAEKNLLITQVELGDFSGAQDTKDRILDVRGMMARGEGSGVSDEDMQTIAMVARRDPAAAAEMFSLRLDDVVTDAWVQDLIDTNLGQPEGADPALTAEDIAMLPTIPSAMAQSFLMDRLKEMDQRPVMRSALRKKYFGTNALTAADEEWLDMLVEDLDVGSDVLDAPNPTMSFVDAADGSVQIYKNGILIDTLEAGVADRIEPGTIESLVPLTAFSNDFHANQVEYLASRRDLNQILLDARPEDFGILNTAVDVFQQLLNTVGIGDNATIRAQADVEQALNTIGFQNLALFVGPTSDFESGLAKMIQGGKQLTRARFQELAARQLKQRLNLYARHNNSVERSLANLPAEAEYLRSELEAKYIRLTPEDVPVFVYDEWMGDMEARSRAGGGARILFMGDWPVTGSPKELSEEVSEIADDSAGQFWNLGGGTPGVGRGFDLTVQGTGGPVNQMRYPWSALPRPDLANRQLFPQGQGLLSQWRR